MGKVPALLRLSALLLVLLLVVVGCSSTPPVEPEPGGDLPGEEPGSQEGDPAPEPGKETDPVQAARDRVLAATDLRVLALEPTAGGFSVYQQYLYYWLPGAPSNGHRLVDFFGGDYPLPHLHTLEVPYLEKATWGLGGKLYYLCRDALDEAEDFALFAYDTATGKAVEHRLIFPQPFRPRQFFLTQEGEALLVGETGAYLYNLAAKIMKKAADFSLEPDILARATWYPDEPLLSYSQGDQLYSFDPLRGETTLCYSAQGTIKEIFWDPSGFPALLTPGLVEVLSEEGKLRKSYAVPADAHSLAWVPDWFSEEKISYLLPAPQEGLPQLIVADFDQGITYTYRSCSRYLWDWEGGTKVWTYSEDGKKAALTLGWLHWDQAPQAPAIPYYQSREEDPRLPLDYGKGNLLKIATELFRLRLEEFKKQGSLSKYTIEGVDFWGDAPWSYLAAAKYSVLPGDDDWVSGNGELGEDGWVRHKYNFIRIYQDGEYYVLGSNWATSP